ncbi:MAG: membrane protein insertase YidC, partial [Bacteroidales bacterium]
MERRVLFAVFLCFVVLYAYQAIFVKTPPARPRTAAQPAGKAAPVAPGAEAVTPAPKSETQPQAATGAAPASVTPVVGDQAERMLTVETQVVRAVFSNRGGELLSWRLKKYLDDKKQPLELVPTGLPAGAPRPFSLRVDDGEATARLDSALFRPSSDQPTIDGTRQPVQLIFEYQDASGLSARKTFSFQPNSYVVQFDVAAAQ